MSSASSVVIPSQPKSRIPTSLERSLPRDVFLGQKEFWSLPSRMRLDDAYWAVPFGITTGGLIAADVSIKNALPQDANTIKRFKSLSNYGAMAYGGLVGGSYVFGKMSHRTYLSDTAWLAGESGLNSLIATYALKYAVGRQRPTEGNGKGDFFSHGQSFPSEHSAAVWSVATVFAGRYPGVIPKLGLLGGAGLISFSRVVGQQHFASDAFVGSALGYYFGRQALRRYQREHETDYLYGTFVRDEELPSRNPANMGSPYVPLDSWIYPLMDRLQAMGVVALAPLGQRPWTRLQCARIVSDAVADRVRGDDSQASSILDVLQREFSWDRKQLESGANIGLNVDSLYSRVTQISGTPVNDSYHFGQTIINDFGRPYQSGFNAVSGIRASASAGPLTLYVSGEYQHAPSAPAYPDSARQAMANADVVPVAPATPFPEINRVDLLDTYVGFAFHNHQLTFGKQSLWWGPNRGGSLSFSNNAEPIEMLRLSRVAPVKLSFLGPVYYDFYFGRLNGHQFPPRPWTYGEKISFKPTRDLELGFSRTVVFAGQGVTPLTFSTFFHSYFSVKSQDKGTRRDPGKRQGGFNFSYRLPWIRDWATIYAEGISTDDPSPLAAPRRAPWRPGIYFSHLPKVPKMDLRLEAVYTDVPTSRSMNGRFIYWDFIYHDQFTNSKNIIGDWIGREGNGLQAWTTYWFSPLTQLQFAYRNARVSSDFIPQGETLHDGTVSLQTALSKQFMISTSVQYEHINAPILNLRQSSNVTTSVSVTFMPPRKGN